MPLKSALFEVGLCVYKVMGHSVLHPGAVWHGVMAYRRGHLPQPWEVAAEPGPTSK